MNGWEREEPEMYVVVPGRGYFDELWGFYEVESVYDGDEPDYFAGRFGDKWFADMNDRGSYWNLIPLPGATTADDAKAAAMMLWRMR